MYNRDAGIFATIYITAILEAVLNTVEKNLFCFYDDISAPTSASIWIPQDMLRHKYDTHITKAILLRPSFQRCPITLDTNGLRWG